MQFKLVVILILLSITKMLSQNNLFFEQGNSLYNEGKYAEAIEKYETIINSGEHSAELYFNLANAHYKLSNVAPSVYYYEKALLLNPTDSDIKNNLSYAQNMTIDDIAVEPEVGFSKLYKSVVNYMSFETWSKLSIVFMFLFVVLFTVYYFSIATNKKRIAFLGFLFSFFLMGLTLGLAFQKFKLDQSNNPAIIFAQEINVKSDPNLNSDTLFTLHEGTKVNVTEEFDYWNEVELSDGKKGWIPLDALKMLNDF